MSDTTPLLGLPFPEGADALTDYPTIGQLLAETLEDKIGLVEISDTLLGSDVASVSISVPSTFDHLLLVALAKSGTGAAVFDELRMRINGLSSALYYSGYIGGTNNALAHTHLGAASSGHVGKVNASIQAGFSLHTIELNDYRAARFRRWLFQAMAQTDAAGADQHYATSGGGVFRGVGSDVANFVTSLELFPNAAGLKAGSRFTLYGRRGAQ